MNESYYIRIGKELDTKLGDVLKDNGLPENNSDILWSLLWQSDELSNVIHNKANEQYKALAKEDN